MFIVASLLWCLVMSTKNSYYEMSPPQKKNSLKRVKTWTNIFGYPIALKNLVKSGCRIWFQEILRVLAVGSLSRRILYTAFTTLIKAIMSKRPNSDD